MRVRASRCLLAGLGGLMLVVAVTATLAQGPSASRARISLLMQQGRFAEAAALLSPLAVASPRDADTQHRLGVCLWRTGKLPAAAQAFQRAHLAKPREAVYVASLARLYADYPNYERASYWYRKLLALRPGNMRLVTEVAQYALDNNRPLDAELQLKRALARNSGDAAGWLLLSQTYQQLGLRSEAAQCLEKAIARKPPKAAELQQIIALYVDGGQPEKALPYLQLAQRQQPNNAALWAQIGSCHLAVNNPRAAIDAYRQAARLAPRVPEYHLTLAGLLAKDDAAGALREYELAFALKQPTAEQLLTASALASRSSNAALARWYLSRLVALQPHEVQPRELLVQAALSGGDQATAVLQWRELQRAGLGSYAVQEAELALRLGAPQWALGRLEEVARTTGDDGELCARIASMFAQLGDSAQARTLAGQALQKGRSDPPTLLLAARVLLQIGDTERAEGVLRTLLQDDPANQRAAEGLARCLLARNQPQAAYRLLADVVRQRSRDFEVYSAFTEAAVALNRLPAAVALLLELAPADPANDALIEGLTYLCRRHGGAALAARQLLALSERQPANGLWAITAARELVAAERWQDAAALYERLAKGSEYTVAARVGLCQLLLTQEKYGDLLGALARLTGPQAIGAEAYKLLLDVRGELVLQTGAMAELADLARAATAVCLSDYQSESYYLGLADLYLATRQTDAGVGYLQAQAASREQAAAATVGLARLLRKLSRAREALVWLDQAPATAQTPAARLERAYCLLERSLPQDAAAVAEAVLRTGDPASTAEAHLVAAEACLRGSRPEEALWHFCRSLAAGAVPDQVTPRIVSLCQKQPIAETAVVSAVHQLYAEGFTQPALTVADALSGAPGFGALKRWAMQRSRG